MQLLKSFEQSIAILLFLDRIQSTDYIKAEFIGQQLGYSVSSTKKVISELTNAKMVRSISGPKGGIILNVDIKDISLYDILIATESKSFFSIDYCLPKGSFGSEHDQRLVETNLKKSLRVSATSFMDHLKDISIKNLTQ
ncbi:Rrf2 family transcriptional regulator [Pediococcus pentosaceus]|nr:Rrf2 family transcriptional regulator [Pediococcus pentosaceus]MBF7106268.1 Rrf2 family transcriptional regulator [Pediococcus pentosaceus]MBF7108923.1 Rrf2 family transcriptional regulator [Pediococcus pentosaceus]MBF7119798.1 Rrf2 family transcriptional regulator [Pediococcus pentosaceus]MBF7127166.1 Rrf2 family transcriptional regulator [Pediococcus pentosaceus]MBF7129895.1 Rrf2 family transcriptional regulator [Pediococcus pentosaceus]